MKRMAGALGVVGLFVMGLSLGAEEPVEFAVEARPPHEGTEPIGLKKAPCECRMPDGHPAAGMADGTNMRVRPTQGALSARGRGEGQEGLRDMVVERLLGSPELAARLGISPEQVTAIKDKLFRLKQAEIKLNAEMELTAMEQARLLTGDKISEADIMAAVEKIGGIRTQLAKVHMQKMLVLKLNLTAEQTKKIREELAKRMGDHRFGEGRRVMRDGKAGRRGPDGTNTQRDIQGQKPSERGAGAGEQRDEGKGRKRVAGDGADEENEDRGT